MARSSGKERDEEAESRLPSRGGLPGSSLPRPNCRSPFGQPSLFPTIRQQLQPENLSWVAVYQKAEEAAVRAHFQEIEALDKPLQRPHGRENRLVGRSLPGGVTGREHAVQVVEARSAAGRRSHDGPVGYFAAR